MKEVVKVSIGEIAFTLEETAYQVLSLYLERLSNFYNSDENTEEIMKDVEERIAELFIEKCGAEGIVSKEIVNEIISILGEPEKIEQESQGYANPEKKHKKRLFRNLSNSVLGGVCSGIAAYFKREPILFRIVFILPVIFSFPFISHHYFGLPFMILLYIVLWIVIPPAKTIDQKCQMNGEENTVADIERKINTGAKKMEKEVNKFVSNNKTIFQKIGGIIFKIIGFFLLLIGLVVGSVFIISLFGVSIAGVGIVQMLSNFLMQFSVVGYSIVLTQIIIILVFSLPVLLLMYSGILLLFGLKSPKWRPGLVIFLLWIVSALIFSLIGASTLISATTSKKEITSNTVFQGDTLYIQYEGVKRYEDSKVILEASDKKLELNYFYKGNDGMQIVHYPSVYLIRRNISDDETIIKTNSTVLMNSLSLKEINNSHRDCGVSLKGDTLTIKPIIYGGDMPLKDLNKVIKIYSKDAVLIIKDPVWHQFENKFKYSNIVGIY